MADLKTKIDREVAYCHNSKYHYNVALNIRNDVKEAVKKLKDSFKLGKGYSGGQIEDKIDEILGRFE